MSSAPPPREERRQQQEAEIQRLKERLQALELACEERAKSVALRLLDEEVSELKYRHDLLDGAADGGREVATVGGGNTTPRPISSQRAKRTNSPSRRDREAGVVPLSSLPDIHPVVSNQILLGREYMTSDLNHYGLYFQQLIDARLRAAQLDSDVPPICEPLWNYIRQVLAGCQTPIGFAERHTHETTQVTEQLVTAHFSRAELTASINPLNPVKLAAMLGVSVFSVITEFLWATDCGLCTMHFGLQCNGCSNFAAVDEKLGELPVEITCGHCATQTRAQELTDIKVLWKLRHTVFYAPSKFPTGVYPKRLLLTMKGCLVAYPTSTGSGFTYDLSLPAGLYRVFCPLSGVDFTVLVDRDPKEEDAAAEVELVLGSLRPRQQLRWEHGKVKVALFTASTVVSAAFFDPFVEKDLVLPRDEYPKHTTVDLVLHSSGFSTLFKDQLVAFEQRLSFGRGFFAFADLQDTTHLYSTLGDEQGLALVRSYWRALDRIIGRHNGRLVKTIGDSVLLSFVDGASAVTALVEVLQECVRYNASERCPRGAYLHLKAAIHVGRALIVPLNGSNDYFGHVVNVTRKLEAAAEAGQIIVTAEALEDPALHATLQQLAAIITVGDEVRIAVKGISDPIASSVIALRPATAP